MLRLIPALAALMLGAAAFAQIPGSTVPAVQQVQLLAPQLIAFSGSTANFESLVGGLTQGTPVTLTTLNPDGSVQIVTFVPGAALSAVDAARTLETARQSLIARGISAPTAQQLAIALMGGTLPTALGGTQVIGALSGNAGATPIQVRNELATPAGTGSTANLTAANLLALRTALAQGAPVTLSGTTGAVTFSAPGGPMSAFEVNQALQLASALLAQQGIVDPTAEQLRVALLGGTLGGSAVQGVLQGRVRNTSDSRLFGTSDSRAVGTSNTAPGPASVPPTTAASGAGGVVVPRAANRITPIFGASGR